MLEKAARALSVRRGWDWELCAPVTRNELAEDARAVLMAIREPDEGILNAGVDYMAGKDCAGRSLLIREVRDSVIGVIDAILAEDTEPKT